MGVPAAVITGPGLLFAAPTGTTEPIDATTALPAAWKEIGFTADGTTITREQTWNAIYVEELLNPVRWEPSVSNDMVAFSMAESTKSKLALAMNMGAAVADDAVALEPPAAGSELRVMLVLNTAAGARWIWRRCVQTGASAMPHKKSPDKAVIPVTFRLEDVSPTKPWKVFPGASPVGIIG